MLLLILAHNLPRSKPIASGASAGGITFWGAMYIPIVVAMAARQNVAGAIDGGGLALLAGVGAVARLIGLNNPQSAMVFGGLMGTTSGVTAGLAATDPKLVPYGAMTATFYNGVGCLIVPSVLFLLVRAMLL